MERLNKDSLHRRYRIEKTHIDRLGTFNEAEVYIKRDDLIGFSFGGNKVRIAAEIFEEIEREGYTSVVSYGSYASNMNRVIAQMAAYYGIKAYIVCKQEADFKITANMKLAEHSGAQYIYCNEDNVRESVDKAIEISKSCGEKPYYIYGDSTGEGNEDILLRAYMKAYKEIADAKDGGFDYIFLASGTGMTQSGLIAGRLEKCGHEQIIGISVARNSDKAKSVIEKNLKKCGYLENNDKTDDKNAEKDAELIQVMDDYLCGGYGSYNEDISELVKDIAARYGIFLDPVYSGKAFYGMLSEIKKRDIKGKVLFIHTGGTPGFFDALFGGSI